MTPYCVLKWSDIVYCLVYELSMSTRTLPWATSSLCAADAAFTNALVAAAMDLAASRICSSKFRLSSASCSKTKPNTPLFLSHGRSPLDFISMLNDEQYNGSWVYVWQCMKWKWSHASYEKSSYDTEIHFHTNSGLPFFQVQTVWSRQEHEDMLSPRKLQRLA